jgi:serine/threonine-protein kinase
MSADLHSRLGSTLGTAYTIERELGGGAMVRVFLAVETALARRVVIKVLSPDLAAGISAQRFAREIRLAASLQQANIVPVLSAGATDDLTYYVCRSSTDSPCATSWNGRRWAARPWG